MSNTNAYRKNKRLLITEQKIFFLRLCFHNSCTINGIEISSLSNGVIPKGSVFALAESLERDDLVTSVMTVRDKKNFLDRIFSVTEKGILLLDFWDKLNK